MGRSRKAGDRALVRACRAGDEAAWTSLVRRYRRLVYSVAVSYRLAASDADEVFQRVWVKLLEHLDRIRCEDNLASWLVTTTRRECQGLLRRAGRTTPLDEGMGEVLAEDRSDVEQTLHAVEREHALGLAFERLDPCCRRLLEALYLEDPAPSYQTLARRLGRPVGSLGPTRARCLGKLKKIFLELGGEPP